MKINKDRNNIGELIRRGIRFISPRIFIRKLMMISRTRLKNLMLTLMKDPSAHALYNTI
jgi:hypothetical protein